MTAKDCQEWQAGSARASKKASPAVLLLKKIKSPVNAYNALKHNLRELPPSANINSQKTHLNRVISGFRRASKCWARFKQLLSDAGIHKPRKDAVLLIEAVVSLPVSLAEVTDRYLAHALIWLKTEFEGATLLSAVIHLDESSPHLHALFVPLIRGRLQGSQLVGGRTAFKARQARFLASMKEWQGAFAGHLQLQHESASHDAQQMAQRVISHLQQTQDLICESPHWAFISQQIEQNPQPWFERLALGSTAMATESRNPPQQCSKQRKRPTMAEIFTRPQKDFRGAKAERYRQSPEYLRASLIAKAREPSPCVTAPCTAPNDSQQVLTAAPPKYQNLCSVGFQCSNLVRHQQKASYRHRACALSKSRPQRTRQRRIAWPLHRRVGCIGLHTRVCSASSCGVRPQVLPRHFTQLWPRAPPHCVCAATRSTRTPDHFHLTRGITWTNTNFASCGAAIGAATTTLLCIHSVLASSGHPMTLLHRCCSKGCDAAPKPAKAHPARARCSTTAAAASCTAANPLGPRVQQVKLKAASMAAKVGALENPSP